MPWESLLLHGAKSVLVLAIEEVQYVIASQVFISLPLLCDNSMGRPRYDILVGTLIESGFTVLQIADVLCVLVWIVSTRMSHCD